MKDIPAEPKTVKYFKTGHHVAKLRILGFKRTVKVIQFLCGIRGHEVSKTDWGYGGGDSADVWCRWCDKMFYVPKDSIRFRFKEESRFMKMLKTGRGK